MEKNMCQPWRPKGLHGLYKNISVLLGLSPDKYIAVNIMVSKQNLYVSPWCCTFVSGDSESGWYETLPLYSGSQLYSGFYFLLAH